MKRVIGIIGPIGAGKDTVGEYIESKHKIPSYQISAPLKIMCAERGVEPTRENLIALGSEIAKTEEGFLAKYLLDRAPQVSVFTGMRQLGQIEVLRASAECTLIAIDAAPAIRFSRVSKNPKPGEAATLEEFIMRETAENSPPNAQRLYECMKMADYTIRNEGTVEELYSAIDDLLVKITTG